MTDRQNDASTTLKTLARLRAESIRGGSDNFDIAHGPQIDVALRTAGMTSEEWATLCTQAEVEESERWAARLVDTDTATVARAQENKRNW